MSAARLRRQRREEGPVIRDQSDRTEAQWLRVSLIGGAILSICLLLVLVALSLGHEIFFVTSDLGRHLTNGYQLIEKGILVSSNFYSYTQPNFAVINHHWGSGGLFHLILRASDFAGLWTFYLVLEVLTFLIFFTIACRRGGFTAAFVVGVLALPLISIRYQIRPEGFSNLLLAVYFVLFFRWRDRGRIPLLGYFAAFVLQVVWVNLHILFVMGPALSAVFSLDVFWSSADRNRFRPWLLLLLVLGFACLINPFGLQGALVPLNIFREYGYLVQENQSALSVYRNLADSRYLHFFFFAAGCASLWLGGYFWNRGRSRLLEGLLIVGFGILAARVSRAIALFGLCAIPLVAPLLADLFGRLPRAVERTLKPALAAAALLLVLLAISGHAAYYSPNSHLGIRIQQGLRGGIQPTPLRSGVGLLPGIMGSARFYQDNDIRGPIFNNYDIGAFLIFYLFPQERVFVDNRPEAYSADFFSEQYIPTQQSRRNWETADAHRNFNCVYFYWRDRTPWGQRFLNGIVKHSDWSTVYIDEFAIILLKRNPKNARVINRYQIQSREVTAFMTSH